MATPKVTLKNKTLWPTRMLLPFVRRIAREEFDGSTPKRTRSHVTVYIGYNRGGKYYSYCSGHAPLNSRYCTVNVPYPHPGRVFPVMDFCHVVGHEFGHCQGLKHEDMGWHYGNSCARGNYSGDHYAWAKALPVPVILKKVAPSLADKRAKKLATAQAAVVTWTRKRKLAENALKRWQRRVKDITRRIEKSAVSQGTKALAGSAAQDAAVEGRAACGSLLGESQQAGAGPGAPS